MLAFLHHISTEPPLPSFCTPLPHFPSSLVLMLISMLADVCLSVQPGTEGERRKSRERDRERDDRMEREDRQSRERERLVEREKKSEREIERDV